MESLVYEQSSKNEEIFDINDQDYSNLKQINIGIIGYGSRLDYLVNLLIKVAPQIKIQGVYDPNETSIKNVQKRYPEVKIYKDYKQLCEDQQIQWIFVGSWNNLHKDHILYSFKNQKNVFCEKPLATTIKDCLEIKKQHFKYYSHIKFIIGFVLRFSPFYQQIYDLVQIQKIVGDPVSLEFNDTLAFDHGGYIMGCWRRSTKLSGGHLLEKTCHDFDIIGYILNKKPEKVASFGGLNFFNSKYQNRLEELGEVSYDDWPNLEKENPFSDDKDIVDNQVVILEYEGGVRATFHTNLNAAIPERRIYILGTHGCIRANLLESTLEYKRVGYNQQYYKIDMQNMDLHGGGDAFIAKTIAHQIYFNNFSVKCGINEAVVAAIICLEIENSRFQNKIGELKKRWKELNKEYPDI